jgi:hypothetical protein
MTELAHRSLTTFVEQCPACGFRFHIAVRVMTPIDATGATGNRTQAWIPFDLPDPGPIGSPAKNRKKAP